jgi:hypothetical protein
MRKLTNLGSALVMAALIATGMVAFSTPVLAQGPGNGASGDRLCYLLSVAEANANALPDSDYKTALLAEINERQAALGCPE